MNEICKGCLQTKKKEDNHCTRFLDKSRAQMIEMFNEMLKYYGYSEIKSTI